MIRTVKVMMIPNNFQQTRMFKTADAARYAYNWTIETERRHHECGGRFIQDGELRTMFTQHKSLPEKQWLYSCSNNATKQSIKDACDAFKGFFKGKRRYPKFKSRKRSEPSFYVDTAKIRFTSTHVKLESIATSTRKNRKKANWIRLAEHGRISVDAKYMNPRVKFDGLNWWITVSYDDEETRSEAHNTGIGIDLGVKDLAICSDGNVYRNINKSKKIKKLEKRKRRLQRKVAQKYLKNMKGGRYCKTRNIAKCEKEILRVSRKITNIRKNHMHQTISDIMSREPRFIVLEDLNVSGMMKNKHLSKAVQAQNFRRFREIVEYKCEWHHIQLIIADRFFPSSKTCSRCGVIKRDLTLKDRIYVCDSCGFTIDRDLQAAINLAKYGERIVNA